MSRIIEQARFICSPLRKALEKQIKANEPRGKKEIKSLQEHGKKIS